MAKEMIKDANNAVSKEVANKKSKADTGVLREDLDNLREDARVMKEDAKTLGRHLKEEGREQLSVAEQKAKQALEQAREKGKDQFADLAAFVQSNPGQSIAIAFVGGIIASMLLGGRRQ